MSVIIEPSPHQEARKAVTQSALAAPRAGQPPTAVAAASPFSEIYIRKLARENGIPDYPLRQFPKARSELEAQLPAWRDAARAIGELGMGLDDAEHVSGVLRTGLTQRGRGEPGGAEARHHGSAHPLGYQGRRGCVHGRRRGPRGPGRVPARPVAARFPRAGWRSRLRCPGPATPRTEGIRDGRCSVRGPRQPDRPGESPERGGRMGHQALTNEPRHR